MTQLLALAHGDADSATTGGEFSRPAPHLAPLTGPAGPVEVGAVTDDDFVLDMRVVESTTPLVVMMCSTSDGCGSSCSTSACATKAHEPI